MALVRERIVKEDFEFGFGTIARTADNGGSLTGNKVGIHSFITEYIDVQKAFGTDNSAVTDAFSNVATGGTLRFTPGVYTLTGSTILTVTGKSLNLIFDEGAYIDATGSTVAQGFPVIQIQGSVGTYYVLGASPTIGARSITVHATLAATLTEGDLIHISTNSSLGGSGETWRSLGGTSYKGEIQEVLSVSGTTVNIKNALMDSYTAANTVVARMAAPRVNVQGLQMKGLLSAKNIAIDFKYIKSLQVHGGNITGFGHTCLSMSYAFHANVIGYSASNFFVSGVGNNYGITIGSSQNVTVSGCNISGGRHAITTGLREPARYINIVNNTLDSLGTTGNEPAFSPHAETDFLRVVGNFIKGGIGMSNIPTSLVDNNDIEIGAPAYPAISIQMEYDADLVQITNNRIRVNATVASSTNAIQYLGTGGKTVKSLVIRNNDVRTTGAGIAIIQSGTGDHIITYLEATDNTIDGVTGRTALLITGIDASNRIFTNTVKVRGGEMRGSVGSSAALLQAVFASIDDLYVEDVVFHDTSAGGSCIPIIANANNSIGNAYIRGNKFIMDVLGQYIAVTVTKRLEFTGNSLTRFSVKNGVLLSAAEVVFRDNPIVDVFGFPDITGALTPITRVATQFDSVATTTVATVTGLTSRTLQKGRAYKFEAILHVTAAALGGHRYAMEFTGTPSSIVYEIQSWNNAAGGTILMSDRHTASGTETAEVAAGATDIFTRITGVIRVNGSGTPEGVLNVRFGQGAASGTSSVLINSTLSCEEIP